MDLTGAADTSGTYYYGACVDAVTDESDTTNNCSTVGAGDGAGAEVPGLGGGVHRRWSDSGPAAGASFTLSATVRNDGEGSSAATTLRYYRSPDATITTSDTEVGTAAVTGLGAAGSSSQSVDLTAPDTSGTYYYGACVDAVTDESDTTNNCSASVQVMVPEPELHPDLAVASISVERWRPSRRGDVHLVGDGEERWEGRLGADDAALLPVERCEDNDIRHRSEHRTRWPSSPLWAARADQWS